MTAISTTAPLVRRFLTSLEARGVSYCHWKSNDALARSASGENDLDLLVSRAGVDGFSSALFECGFKEARPAPRRRLPGVFDYYGFDDETDRLIHVHAHHKLILGHDLSKNYHLSIEEAFLRSSRSHGVFRVPAVEFDYIVFVIRMMAKHGTWEAPLVGRRALSGSEQRERTFLESAVDQDEIGRILREHVPSLSPELFDRCARTLSTEISLWERFGVGRRFVRSMEGYARRPRWADVSLKLWRRVYLPLRGRLSSSDRGRTLVGGGAIIAVVGGDGSGKSTAVDGLHEWLRPTFRVRKVHMGKPDRSLASVVGTTALRAARLPQAVRGGRRPERSDRRAGAGPPGLSRLLNKTFMARDRYLAYRRSRRFASNGGLVVADRFPLSQINLMDGGGGVLVSGDEHGLRPRLARKVNDYYARIRPPEVLLVLRVDPEVAVGRKTDETEESVRARSTEIWELDWTGTGAHVVDAGQSREDVLRELKRRVWSLL